MATKRVQLKGKAQWFRPWELDTEFADDVRGGNYAVNVIFDADGVVLFNAMGAKAKLHPENGKNGGEINRAVFRRYERHPVLGELGPVIVNNVPDNTLVGNGSDLLVDIDLYDYEYKGRPAKGIRLVGVTVENLVEYKPEETSKPAVGVPVV